ncbi:DUF5687 family protein [Echinicola vietnamensis]|uniref:Uncharacterized protein n=1 Tax=Echinicola vietnamensis (strain DSM 17526 / LMG 23754 / KMM 6221) TaxID=926556 RepID=L0G0P0_ECHVK|nr:DUF5687 family protein [Echinicola vietnamensis]AGA78551.1 hypothetical protein Echvi_2303 [Echinicola vietnamensis DSM 17526]
MIKHLVILQWKSFFRSAAFSSNLAIKILMGFAALYMMLSFGFMGVATFYMLEKMELNAFETVNRFMVYYLVFDLVVRYMLQKMPVVQIKPMLFLPIKKSTIVQYSIWKTILSFFNIIHAFFFIPFAVVLVINGYEAVPVLLWMVGIYALLLANNFINIFLNGVDAVLFSVLGLLASLGLIQYYGVFDLSIYTGPVFQSFYDLPLLAFIPVLFMLTVYWVAFKYFRERLYLDAGLSSKVKEAKSENLAWLDRFGSIAVFLKNDIKLIKRNKRSKTTVLMSVMFLFYGLLFFTNSIEAYQGPAWRIFAALFVTGGFLFSFGQYVPSWDSSYYPLMMSQNIRYRDYLNAKWWLMVIATVVSTILASFYAYFGWEVYLAILVAGIYNIGVNSYMVLWGGVYVRTPIDLSSNKGALGSSQAFNAKTLLLTIPKLLLPMVLYVIGHFTVGPYLGYLLVAISAILGFAFKEKVFNLIEKNYKTEKYKTLAAYKQKS